MADRHEEGCYEKKQLHVLSCFAKAYGTMTSGGGSRGTVFQKIRPGAGFETGDFVKERLRSSVCWRLSDRRGW